MNKHFHNGARAFCPQRITNEGGRPSFLLAFLILAACGAHAGSWTFQPWANDGDIPHPAPELVTHAVAFGIGSAPPVPSPFEKTAKISGESWAVWKHPDHTASVGVSTPKAEFLDSITVDGEGASLLRGYIHPARETPGGLAIELSGLEPGRSYSLVFFRLRLGFTPGAKKFQVKTTASDAPGQEEFLDLKEKGLQLLIYEYTAPPDGLLAISFEDPGSNSRSVRFSAFLNHRGE